MSKRKGPLDPANFTAFAERHPDRHYAWQGIVSLGTSTHSDFEVGIRIVCPHKHRNVLRAEDCAAKLLALATRAIT